MKKSYMFYLVLLITVLSCVGINYPSGLFEKYWKAAGQRYKRAKNSVRRTIWGRKSVQGLKESITEQPGIRQNIITPMNPSEISKKFREKENNIGWIAWIKKKLGFDIEMKGNQEELQLKRFLLDGQKNINNLSGPDRILYNNSVIHKLIFQEQKTQIRDSYVLQWYVTPFLNQNEIPFLALKKINEQDEAYKPKEVVFAVALKKDISKNAFEEILYLYLYKNQKGNFEASRIVSNYDINLLGKEHEPQEGDDLLLKFEKHFELLNFVKNILQNDYNISIVDINESFGFSSFEKVVD